MDDLAERIKASIKNPNGELWFPELTADLVAQAWDCLHRDLGLTPDCYGTERVLSRDLCAPRQVITFLRSCPSTCATAPTISIEALSPSCAVQYQKQGVTFYTPDEILDSPVLSCLEEALAVINQVPSLMRTVFTLVHSLHVLKPSDDDLDVSFSEPHVPFSIFVSVPERRIANDALRIAEAIVHEAMHLQLTLLEGTASFVVSRSEKYYSPWKREHRTAHGILHGLYVFKVIERFLKLLVCINGDTSCETEYLLDRCFAIDQQLQTFRSFDHCSDLSNVGACMVQKLMQS